MNNSFSNQDTIAAIATPFGEGGISVIRVSGEKSFEIVDAIFKGKNSIQSSPSHTILYGKIISNQTIIDTVLISIFRKPHSYTGENVIEISCHGGYFTAKKILEILLQHQLRLAEPGEFTQRAFLNGKMDLLQAEAVADIIHSKTEQAHKTSIEQLQGRLSHYVEGLRNSLIELCSLLELELDFSQEGIELIQQKTLLNKIDSVIESIKKLLSTYTAGKVFRDGIKVVLVGKPNAGKSSLLNILLNEQRAIVSDIPGTTRDVIEENILIKNVLFRLVDTAGLREAEDVIEREGVRRTELQVENSNIILLLVDCSALPTEEDLQLYKRIKEKVKSKNNNIMFLYNKSDIENFEFKTHFQENPHIYISCKTGKGIEELKNLLIDTAIPNYDSSVSSILINNLRHKSLLESTLKSLANAKSSIEQGMSGDFIAVDMRESLNYLGELIGITTPDDILNNIFSKFCIGK